MPKPKTNLKDIPKRDRCQTPPYALDPLWSYLDKDQKVWEPAAGDGYLVHTMKKHGYTVTASDILEGHNYLHNQPPDFDVIVTNPPYSIKYKWLARTYQLGKPFALLLPLETLGAKSAQVLFKQHAMQIIILNKRVNFKMPNQGWNGSGAQFPVAWFTWQLKLGKRLIYRNIHPRSPNQYTLFDPTPNKKQPELFD